MREKPDRELELEQKQDQWYKKQYKNQGQAINSEKVVDRIKHGEKSKLVCTNNFFWGSNALKEYTISSKAFILKLLTIQDIKYTFGIQPTEFQIKTHK